MKTVLLLIIAALVTWIASNSVLRSQAGGDALVVATCGTLPQPYAVGSTRQPTVNTAGVTCVM